MRLLSTVDVFNNNSNSIQDTRQSVLRNNMSGNPPIQIVIPPFGAGEKRCGNSDVIIHLDLMEGKENMASKVYQSEYGAGCAVILRLNSHWRCFNC